MKRISAIAAIVAMGFAATAMADDVSYTTASFSDSASNNTSLTAEFQQFNPTLGTLTGASIQLDLTVAPTLSVLNFSANAQPFNFIWEGTTTSTAPAPNGFGAPVSVTDPYGNFADTDFSYEVTNGTANPTTSVNPFFAITTFTDPTPISINSPTTIVPIASLNNYVGTGTYDLTYLEGGDVQVEGQPGATAASGSLAFGYSHPISGTATITYSYTPDATPLPKAAGGGMLLLACLAGSAKLRRKTC